MSALLRFSAVCLALVLWAGAPAMATSVYLPVVDDATAVYDQGVDGWVLQPDGFYLDLFRAGPDTLNQGDSAAALEFNLASLPPGATITSAQLVLAGALFDESVNVFTYADDGAVVADNFFADNFVTNFSPGPGLNMVDVTGVVQAQGPGGFIGFTLHETMVGERTIFLSSLAEGVIGPGPRLQVDYTVAPIPEPVTITALLMGVMGVGAYVRRRRMA